MNIIEMKDNQDYVVVSFGNLTQSEIEILNANGLILGEQIQHHSTIKCNKKACILQVESLKMAIPKRVANEIGVELYEE